jgi:hypothetical protein
MFALHWQSPDEGHVNVWVLASVFLIIFKQKLCQQTEGAVQNELDP